MKNQTVYALLLMFAVLLCLTGCRSERVVGLDAPGMTKQQVNQYHYEAIQTDLWQMQNDIDAFFLFDRPGRMSRWSVR